MKGFIWEDVFKIKTWESEAKQLDSMIAVLSIKKFTQVFWENKAKDSGFFDKQFLTGFGVCEQAGAV